MVSDIPSTTFKSTKPARILTRLHRAEQVLTRLACRRSLSCLLIAIAALALRAALLPLLPIPTPAVHDEFAYILGGETFALGRLANPPHPMWQFFETFHVNMRPTYAAKYPPGQAVFLALGIRVFGHPWLGVWLSVGLLCGILCWTFQGWLPPKYALIGAMLATMQLAATSYWVNSYWGGAVAGIGGALVLGALPRLTLRPRVRDVAAGLAGVFVLAHSRPFEGSVLVVLSLGGLIWWAHRRGSLPLLRRRRVTAAAIMGFAVICGSVAYYNWRVTGNSLQLPYMLNSREYRWAPAFWMLRPTSPPVRFRDEAMRQLWEWDNRLHLESRRHPVAVLRWFSKTVYATFVKGAYKPLYLVAVLTLALSSLIRVRVALVLLTGFLVVTCSEKVLLAHYLAPAVGLVLLLPLFGLRAVRTLRFRGRRIGLYAVTAVIVLCCASFATTTARDILYAPRELAADPMIRKTTVTAQLSSLPGLHLVLVRYGRTHNPHREFVYNAADIDAQRVVWALDRGLDENARLLAYYSGRTAWLFQPDGPEYSLERYSGQAAH